MGQLYHLFIFFQLLPNYAIAMVLSRNFSQTRNQIQYRLIRASVPRMKLVNSQSGSYRKQLMPQTYSKRGYTTLKNFLCKIKIGRASCRERVQKVVAIDSTEVKGQ